ncbi:MAG TPA: HAD family phosphatase [Mycobacteriales bacterium]|nr:HAD family phosphatase [Mycobacteriales bacterium]
MTGQPEALLIDYGGVLTTPPADSFRRWLAEDRLDRARFRELMHGWLAADAPGNVAHDLETGRLTPEEFERRLIAELVRPDGSTAEPTGLLSRMFAGMEAETSMIDVVRRLHVAGVRTGLVSNSWGFSYPTEGWADLFDAVVISGEVGARKPEPEIYLMAAAQLRVPPSACVFVDDLAANVRGAAAVGMIGVHHTGLTTTVDELEILFDRSLQ